MFSLADDEGFRIKGTAYSKPLEIGTGTDNLNLDAQDNVYKLNFVLTTIYPTPTNITRENNIYVDKLDAPPSMPII